jgi:hypothetical protein
MNSTKLSIRKRLYKKFRTPQINWIGPILNGRRPVMPEVGEVTTLALGAVRDEIEDRVAQQ